MNWTRLQQKLAEQYLNTYLRELAVDLGLCHLGQQVYLVPLQGLNTKLQFKLSHYSTTGYHRYLYPITLINTDGNTTVQDVEALVDVLCQSLATLANHDAAKRLREQIQNSLEHCHYYTEARQANVPSRTIAKDFIAAEQGLLLGHPFHVTSKAMQGFSEADRKRYSPELGAAFKLHYFAVAPRLMTQRVLNGQSLPQDPTASQAAKALLPKEFQHYQLLPCHPWQANMLLDAPQLQTYLKQEEILSLGPLGETAWPTSSVRTVFLPNLGLFIKLSLDVRITNFIRNNPPSHIARAMDASDFLSANQLCDSTRGLLVLPELGAQTLAIPDLEASFAILYRQGLNPAQARQTRVVASLVEECPLTGNLPLAEFIVEAAHHHGTTANSQFVAAWWRAYVYASLLPALELFATSGVSLEAHLQNSLMLLAEGWPQTLVVRDMEGASITARSNLPPDAGLAADSHASYSEDEAWFRFQYYVVVNHIAHVLSAIARHFPVSEAALWQVCNELLSDESVPDEVKPYCQALLRATSLPAKGNLLSTLQARGESPVWVTIANPLVQSHAPTLAAQQTAAEQSEQRVIRQLLEALCYEQVLPLYWHGDVAHININAELSYQFNAKYSAHFNRLRLDATTLIRCHGCQYQTPTLTLLLADLSLLQLAKPQDWLRFSDELFHTMMKHAEVLAAKPTELLRELGYAELEAKVNNGHLYHPSFKSRLGFTLTDNQHYGPELAKPFAVQWLAVQKSLARFDALAEFQGSDLLQASFNAVQQAELHAELTSLGLSLDSCYILPVHPWQWQHIGQLYFAQDDIYPLQFNGPQYLPQQSIRTLSQHDEPAALSIKLAMSITNTSTSRVLAPHTVANASAISSWLCQCVADVHAWQHVVKPILLREVAGLSVAATTNLPAQYGALACIWRDSIERHLHGEQRAVPVTALMQLDHDGQPVIAPWVAKYGLQLWLERLIDVAYLPVMHMLWHHGLAMESHAQNMVLILDQELPVQVALKDFHDGVRYNPAWLANAALLPQLTDAPAAHAAVNPNSFLVTTDADELRDFTQDALCFVNLGELGWFIEQHFGLSGTQFWQLVAKRVLHYQQAHPHLTPRFKLFDFFAPQIAVEQLASRRFLPEQRLRVMAVDNPLFIAKQALSAKTASQAPKLHIEASV
ncbi:IucA/IucC family protein [Pseudoalteromonas fenneropenaei]|uniref:IucA/IucC family protein n=1 Tax=Pseudoalteromonas fenneropenaei TaxID=1737459 RepID=A0ABV7CJ34_9GAMM